MLVDQNVTKALKNGQTYFDNSAFLMQDDTSHFYNDSLIYLNDTSFTQIFHSFQPEWEQIRTAQQTNASFPSRNRWADVGRRVAMVNQVLINTNGLQDQNKSDNTMVWVISASVILLAILLTVLIKNRKEQKKVVKFEGPTPTEYTSISQTMIAPNTMNN